MPEVPYDDIIGNLDSPSQAAAVTALGALLQQQPEDAPGLAARIAKSLHTMESIESISATQAGLNLLQPWKDVPEVLSLAIDLALPMPNDKLSDLSTGQRQELTNARVFAVGFLSKSDEERAYETLYALVTDGDQTVRDAAIAVVPELAAVRDRLGDLTGLTPRLAGSGSTWFVEGAFEGPEIRVVETVEAVS